VLLCSMSVISFSASMCPRSYIDIKSDAFFITVAAEQRRSRARKLCLVQWRREDLLRGGAKLEIMSWGTYGELQGRVQQLLDDK